MAFKILRLCPASLYTERAKSALFSFFFLGAILDCNAEFPQCHKENHISGEALDVSHTLLSSFFFSRKNKNNYFEWFILRSQSVQLSC